MASVSIDQKSQYVRPSARDDRSGELPTRRKFLIFGVLAFGQFMALIDIQIVAASLNDIQAGLSAGPDEISWVQTAYLMAELVMIPFSAFLAGSLSTRWLFSLSAGLFTMSSIACGFAWNIESMIVFRAVQGFVGGAMVPTAFSVGFTLFEGKQRAMIPAILGIVSVLAPTLGPTVGGIITQAIDWRWIFFINVLPGIVITTLAVSLIRVDKPNLSLLAKIDWVHLIAMAVALACLQYVLEEGPRKDWFGDPHIQIAMWCSLVGFVLFFERSFASHNPIVRLTPFGRPTFAFSCVFNLVVGFGLYASTYLVPVYLGRVRGYDSLQIGTTVFIVGLGQIVGTIISARLSQTVDRRILLTIGLIGFSFSLWLASHLNAQWGFWELALPQVVRGLSIMFCIVPTVGMALGGFQGTELRNASGLFNLMRNLGGAIGIATVNTWLGDAARIQAARFGEGMAGGGRVAEETLAALAARMSSLTPDPNYALSMAQAVFGRLVGREALVVGFGEVFRTMSWMFVIALVMVPFCDGRPEGATEAAPSPDTH